MMIFTGREVTEDRREDTDVCVIGSGAGGAVAAAELAEGGLDVVILEEGGYYTSGDFTTDPREMLIKLYRNAGISFILGSPGIAFSEGRCVGGSTVINGGMCRRPSEKLFKRWAWEHGLTGITPEGMDPFFRRVEEAINVAPQSPESVGKGDVMIKKAAESLGYRVVVNTRNQKSCVGMDMCMFGCPGNRKQSTLITYVPRALEHGARLFADCRATKVRKQRTGTFIVTAWVLDRETGKRLHSLTVRSKAVVLACGALQTPVLLLGSRLANSSGQVGRNFSCHPNIKVIGIYDDEIRYWKGVHQAYQIHEFIEEGIIMATGGVHPAIVAMALPYAGKKHLEVMEQFNHMIATGALIDDTTSGRVVRGPGGTALMFYTIDRIEFQRILRAAAILSEIHFTAGARKVLLPFPFPDELSSIEDIRKIFEAPIRPGQVESMTVHAMSTCRMGSDPRRSVVNQWGESHDVKGLFIADAGVIPTSLGVNPMLTIMALATRTSRHILENRKALGLP